MKTNYRNDFPMLNKEKPLIYFDNAATTFKPYCVVDKVCEYYTQKSVNIGRGEYELTTNLKLEYEAVRKKIADFINADANEIVFTNNTTSALNMASFGLEHLINANDIVYTTQFEHASSILPWMKVCENKQAHLKYIPLTEIGRIDYQKFESLLNSQVKVIALAHISNVLGYINDIRKIVEMAKRYQIIVIVDVAQSIAHLPIDVKALGCDILAFSAHKMYGPNGVGILYCRKTLLSQIQPTIYGGGNSELYDFLGNIQLKPSPYHLEAGTPNIENVLGFEAAIDYVKMIGFNEIQQREKLLHTYLMDKMRKLTNIEIYNDADIGIVVFNVKGIFAQDVASYLSSKNIAIRSGQHCSRLLNVILGTSATLRISLAFYNTFEEIDEFIAVIQNIRLEDTIDIFL